MAGPILVDSTVLIRLVSGGYGADFAVNLFSRAEEGVEQLIVPSTAVVEALSATIVASVSASKGITSIEEVAKLLRDSKDVRNEAYQNAARLVSYISQLAQAGRLIVYDVSVSDLADAVERSLKENLSLKDSLTLVIADKLRIQKIASFSKELRTVKGYTILPSS
ncbi:MAG: hypothetical protein DSY37_02330 [Hyperthermus sp.]|nr:MAG: hypothetical protein DSY37_02330 [Hyperthermus sp.]